MIFQTKLAPNMTPRTLEELDKCLSDCFVILDGPPNSSIILGTEQHCYETFAVMGEASDNATLVKELWETWFLPYLPKKKEALFWRRRPEIEERVEDIFVGEGISREAVADGAEIPPGYKNHFDTNTWRRVDRTRLVRMLSCRVWWASLPKGIGNKEGHGALWLKQV